MCIKKIFPVVSILLVSLYSSADRIVLKSGSTLIGAEQTGRNAFLMELDPPYCDVIVQRWEEFTGKKAKRIEAKKEAA